MTKAQALSEAPSASHRIEICQECRSTAWCTTLDGLYYCDPCYDAALEEDKVD